MPGLADFQISYGGVTFGEGTDFEFSRVEGLDAPDVRDNDQDRFDRDGAVQGKDLLSKRFVVLEMDTAKASAASLEVSMAALRTVTVRRIQPYQDLPLYFKLPSIAERFVNARPTKRKIPLDMRYARLNPLVVVEFKCADPAQYSETLTTTSWSADGTTQVLNNLGNVSMYPVVEIDGPVTSPLTIINDTLGRTITITQTFATGTLIVDLHKGTVKGDDGNDYYANVTTTSKWWWLVPGNNSIRVVTNGSAARRVKWRSAWDGI